MINNKLKALWVALLTAVNLHAQKPVSLDNGMNQFYRAEELYTNGKYNAASDLFTQFVSIHPNHPAIADALFLRAMCASELQHPDALQQFQWIQEEYPGTPVAIKSGYQTVRILYRDKKYKEVYKKAMELDKTALEPEEEHEYYMMKGFSAYKIGQMDEAKDAFAAISSDSNKYYFDANYYKGYIHYLKHEDDPAEACLLKVLSHNYYGQVAPSYLAQIYLNHQKYREALNLTDTITRKELVYEAMHVSAIAAYHLGDFQKSSDKYDLYYKSSKPMSDTDWYMAGKSHAMIKDYEKAVFAYNKVKTTGDTFSIRNMYELGLAYLKSGKKEHARSAFQQLAVQKLLPELAEESGYYQNLLSVELYHEDAPTISKLHDYIEKYPKGLHTDELKDILSGLLLNSRQYQKTLELLDHLESKTERVKLVIQKSAFCRGEELYAQGQLKTAEEMFKKSLEYPMDSRFKALSGYWLAEIASRDGKYEQAIKLYQDFIKTGEATKSVHYATCFYNIAWCYLKQNNYAKASNYFKEFNELENYLKNDQNMLIDGHVRLADCCFMLRNYQEALNEYNWVITRDQLYHDYALFQKGILYGLMNKPYEKINTLSKIPEVYEESDYMEKALYELGYTNFYLDKYEEALDWFDQLITKRKNGNEVRRAQLNIGLIFKRQHKISQAIEQFQYVIKNYTQSEEAKEALALLKQSAIENGNLSMFNSFIASVPGLSAESAENDSDLYEAFNNALFKQDSLLALEGMEQYIKNFPQGAGILTAHFLRAEILYKQKKYDSALPDYEWISNISSNEHSERATRNAASILYGKKDYTKAIGYFEKLEPLASNPEQVIFALNGQMRCAVKLKETSKIKAVCKKILERKDAPRELFGDARYELAGILSVEQPDEAYLLYKDMVKGPKNMKAAESKYMIALLQYRKLDTLGCKKTIKELNRDFNDFEFWVAKGFLLLSDNYILMRDTFQAKATLNSLIENFEPDSDDPEDIRKLAMEKLNALQPKPSAIVPENKPEIQIEEENDNEQ